MDKRFDRIVKDFADEAPMTLLWILHMVQPGAHVTVVPLRPETSPPIVMPDYSAVVTIDNGAPFTFHVEFQLEYSYEIPPRMARYGVSLAWQYGRIVLSVLILLRPQGVPERVPTVGVYAVGETSGRHPYRVVKLWELDGSPIVELGDPRMYPWAMLMKLSDTQAQQLAKALVHLGNEELLGRFLTLGALRYDRERLEEVLGGRQMGLVEAILQGSSLVKEVVDKAVEEAVGPAVEKAVGEAVEKAVEKAVESTKQDEVRRLLRRALRQRLPGLDEMPEIDAIHNVETLESLLLNDAFSGKDRGTVKNAIIEAASASTPAA